MLHCPSPPDKVVKIPTRVHALASELCVLSYNGPCTHRLHNIYISRMHCKEINYLYLCISKLFKGASSKTNLYSVYIFDGFVTGANSFAFYLRLLKNLDKR